MVDVLYKNGADYIEKDRQRKEMERKKNSFFAKQEDGGPEEIDILEKPNDEYQDSDEMKDDYRNFRFEKDSHESASDFNIIPGGKKVGELSK